MYRKEKESGLKRFKMDWIIETEFNYDKNMWRSVLRYSGTPNKDGSVKYNRLCSSLHADKQPTDEVLEYFERKKKEFTEFLLDFKSSSPPLRYTNMFGITETEQTNNSKKTVNK